MQNILWLVLGAAAAAVASDLQPRKVPWDGDGPYNVSGMFALPSYDLSKPPAEQSGERPSWNMTQKLRYNETEKVIEFTTGIIDPVHRENPEDHVTNRALEGWDFNYFTLKGPLRNTSEPVQTDCSDMLTPECIGKLQKYGGSLDGTFTNDEEHACLVIFQLGQCTYFTIPIPESRYETCSNRVMREVFTGRSIQYVASRSGAIGSGGGGPTDGVKSYDEEMRRPVVLYAGWTYQDKMVSEQVACFSLDDFQPGSRTLAQALSDVNSDGDGKPGSSAGNKSGNQTGDWLGDKSSALPGSTPTDKPGGKPGDKSGGGSDNSSDSKGKDGKSMGSIAAVPWMVGLLTFTFTL